MQFSNLNFTIKSVSVSALIPEVLVFGSDDYVADIGAVRTKSASELLYARQKMVNSDKFLLEIPNILTT